MKKGGLLILLFLCSCTHNYHTASLKGDYYTISDEGVMQIPQENFINSKELIKELLVRDNI
jgi:hypothetical protein